MKRFDVDALDGPEAAVLRHPDVSAVYAMWNALRGDRVAPFRAELDAAKIGARAPFLAIFEHVGPSNHRVRIAGDRLNRWFGLELRGMSALSIADAICRTHLQAALNRVTGEPAAVAFSGAARAEGGFAAPFEAVALPMRSDFGPVDRVLFALWLNDPAATPARPLRLRIEEIVVAPLCAGEPEAAPTAVSEPPAEAPAPAPATGPRLTPIEGGGAPEPSDAPAERPSRPRRGHLRLVKSDVGDPQRRK